MTMENKKVSMEEMGKVTGGTLTDSSADSKFLGALTGKCDRYGTGMIYWSTQAANEVKNAWAELGVTVEMKKNDPNRYFVGGKEISRDEAMEHAQNVVGKHIDRKTWDW